MKEVHYVVEFSEFGDILQNPYHDCVFTDKGKALVLAGQLQITNKECDYEVYSAWVDRLEVGDEV